MKLTPFQISLGVSLLIHAMIFGAIGLNALRPHPPTLERKDSVITLTLVAAPPDSPAQPENRVTEIVAPAPVAPPTPIQEEIKKSEAVIPIQITRPMPAPETPAAAPSLPSPPSRIHGDGSSAVPGLDATTQKAEVGVRAEPNYRKNPEPPYPLAARRRHQEGLVLFTVKVTAQGRAAEVTLKQSSGFPLLDEAALQAVRGWEFTPARMGSIAVKSEIEVPVRFKLTD